MRAGTGGEEQRPDQAVIAYGDARDRGIDEAAVERRGGDGHPGDGRGERHRPRRRDSKMREDEGRCVVPGASVIDQNNPIGIGDRDSPRERRLGRHVHRTLRIGPERCGGAIGARGDRYARRELDILLRREAGKAEGDRGIDQRADRRDVDRGCGVAVGAMGPAAVGAGVAGGCEGNVVGTVAAVGSRAEQAARSAASASALILASVAGGSGSRGAARASSGNLRRSFAPPCPLKAVEETDAEPRRACIGWPLGRVRVEGADDRLDAGAAIRHDRVADARCLDVDAPGECPRRLLPERRGREPVVPALQYQRGTSLVTA